MKWIVGFSGGIDSQAAMNWALDAHGPENVIGLNANPGDNEHPLTTEFIQWFSDHVHPIVICRAFYRDMFAKEQTIIERGFDPAEPVIFGDLAAIRGRFPSRKAQFCTELLKLRPSKRWINENVYERVTGLRRDESDKRSCTPQREWDEWFDCFVQHPLAFWTKQQCFDFCLARGQRVNPLYALGFRRVGCALCINSSRPDIRNWAKRFPEMIDKVRRREQKAGRTFFAPMVPGKEINWVDEVVAWANCQRGGRQYSLDVWMPAPVCESIFGLCD
jgi:3'-phosphoadenosine 5'-phosphosulfate sulfotransferase (PAPS reductase)/FAD synthetase